MTTEYLLKGLASSVKNARFFYTGDDDDGLGGWLPRRVGR